jgi:plasmid maintenance system antidote protein VapI
MDTAQKGGEMYTAAKLAEALGVSPDKVKKLLAAQNIQPDEVKRGCKYYGAKTLEALKAALK